MSEVSASSVKQFFERHFAETHLAKAALGAVRDFDKRIVMFSTPSAGTCRLSRSTCSEMHWVLQSYKPGGEPEVNGRSEGQIRET
ncbi:hypothetical protein [Arthrobacter tecti]